MKHIALFIEPTAAQLNIFSAFTLPRLGSFILAGLVNRRPSWNARVFVEGRKRFDLQVWIAEHGRPDVVGISTITPTVQRGYALADECRALGIPPDIGLRHHLAHFQHLYAGSSYAAGYYVYMWAEVLEADAFDAFDQATAQRLLRHIYSAGNREDPAQAFRAFRGRDARIEPMLVKRGLRAAADVGLTCRAWTNEAWTMIA